MFSNRILHFIVSIICWAFLYPRYCYPLLLERSAEVILSPMNTSIDPCEDFYGFACGSHAQNVSADWNPQAEIHNSMLRNISEFLEMNSSASEPRILHKARALYRSCMEANAQSLKSLADALQQVGLPVTPPLYNASENFSYWYTMARSKVLFNMNFLIEPRIWQNNSTHVWLTLDRPTNDGPYSFFNHQRDSSAETNSGTKTRRLGNFLENARTLTEVMHVYANETVPDLTSSDFNSTFANVQELDNYLDTVKVASFKESRALAHFRKFVTQSCQYNITSRKYKLDWTIYIATLMEDTHGMCLLDHIHTWDSVYVKYVIQCLEVEYLINPEKLELYMWWKMVDKLAPYSAIFEYTDRNLWCARKVNDVFPQATALMLANRSDVLQAMTKIGNMAEDIRNAFNNTLTNVTWMNQTEKDVVRKRLADMTVSIGYPLWLNDSGKVDKFHEKYDQVSLVEDDFLANMLKLVKTRPRIENSMDVRLGLCTECAFKSLDVNSYYRPYLNEIAIPAGYLQFPNYGHVLPALNFGTIGTTIGHEMSHGFDDDAMEFFKFFQKNNTAEKEYSRRLRCFVAHYRHYYSKQNATDGNSDGGDSNTTAIFEDEASMAIGQRTVDEDLSDNNGLKLAFDAYKDYSKKHGSEPTPNGLEKYSQDQLFFIAYANKLCSRYSQSSLGDSTDVHSPDRFRVWGALRNSEDFAKTWGCRKGSWMNPDADKCKLW